MATATANSTFNTPPNRSASMPNGSVSGKQDEGDDFLSKVKEPLHDAFKAIDEKRHELTRDASRLADKVKQNPLPAILSGIGVLVLAGGVSAIFMYQARQRNRPFAWLRKIF
jgi:hypothetical protein